MVLAFALQAVFLWTVFLQRDRLTGDFLPRPPAQGHAGWGGACRASTTQRRLARMAGLHRNHTQQAASTRGHAASTGVPPTYPTKEAAMDASPPRGINVPEPGEGYDEPIASTEGGSIPPSALAPYDNDDESEPAAGSATPPAVTAGDSAPDPDEEPA